MKPLRWLTVSLTRASAEAPTVLSLIGCTRLRAVSGILRTQRGRRGSGGAGLHAGTAPAGPGQCGRPGPSSSRTLPLAWWLKSHARPCGSSLSLAPVAQVTRSPLWLKSLARPCGSSLSLAPVAQAPRSPLWLKSAARPCGSSLTPAPSGSTLAGVGQRPTATGHGCQPGCVLVCRIAGPYHHCRPRWVCSGAGSGRGCRA